MYLSVYIPISICVVKIFSNETRFLSSASLIRLAVLIYDDEMETANVFRHDDPILKKLE